MKGIATCEDCQFNITIYRFTGSQGFFSVPKKWCEECDLLVEVVKKTISELGLENKTQLTIKPWFLWFWQPLFTRAEWGWEPEWDLDVMVDDMFKNLEGKLTTKGKTI